jgi:hypothetical protein
LRASVDQPAGEECSCPTTDEQRLTEAHGR